LPNLIRGEVRIGLTHKRRDTGDRRA
jgi:hypothetical protein